MASPRVTAVLTLLASALAWGLAETPPVPAPRKDFQFPPASVEEYLIGPHDLLVISVFELKELDRKVRVTAEGTVSLPLLGDSIPLAGLTPSQAEQAIATLLREKNLVKSPQVSVFVEEYVSRQVSVQGAVYRPGTYQMLGQKTLLDMIGEAGGLNERAGKTIFVLRPFAVDDNERMVIDAQKLVNQGNTMLNVQLQPGDIVMVPYEQELRVYVNGAVRNPGAIRYPSDEPMTVLRAVTAAGGVTERANKSRVKIIRTHENGTKEVISINLSRIQRGKNDDTLLLENDVIVVPESFF